MVCGREISQILNALRWPREARTPLRSFLTNLPMSVWCSVSRRTCKLELIKRYLQRFVVEFLDGLLPAEPLRGSPRASPAHSMAYCSFMFRIYSPS